MSTIREWTASAIGNPALPGHSAVRGAPTDAKAEERRCGLRRAEKNSAGANDLGFRCCQGPPHAVIVPAPSAGETYRKLTLSRARLASLLKSSPQTQDFAAEATFFREPEAAHTVVDRGPGQRKGFRFTVKPLIWKPVPGAEFLVLTARSGKDTSLVAVYHVMGEDDYSLASSFVMKKEPGPIALAYTPDIRPRLHFSNCWGCLGETGKILYREPDRAVILQP